jgi:hypothetical protein
MNNDGVQNEQGLLGGFEFAGVYGLGQTNETVWRCDAMRAGMLYSRTMFDTRGEAEEYARNMRNTEPDQMFLVESVAASSVWN